MSAESCLDLRAFAKSEEQRLSHPYYGAYAGWIRFGMLFGRDIAESINLAASSPFNLYPQSQHPTNSSLNIESFWKDMGKGLELLAKLQGQNHVVSTKEEPGKILHQHFDNRHGPVEQLEGMEKEGWPIEIHDPTQDYPESYKTVTVYYADDTTPRFLSAIHNFSKTRMTGNCQKDYLEKMLPYTQKAFQYLTSKTDQSGLIVSDPYTDFSSNPQSERDSDDAYRLESGARPQGPRKYLSVESHFLGGLMAYIDLNKTLDQPDQAKDAQEIYKLGLQNFSQTFWDDEIGYFRPLVYGDNQKVDFINDEAIDPLFYGLATQVQAEAVARRIFKPDFDTEFGQRSRPISSSQWYPNGPRAYWNGDIWPHYTGKTAAALERNHLTRYAYRKDAQLKNHIKMAGCEETAGISYRGRRHLYHEDHIPASCNPQLWATAAVLARCAPRD